MTLATPQRSRSGHHHGGHESPTSTRSSRASSGSPKPNAQDDRQIAASVRYGRKCTFYPMDNDSVTGYVGGIERFNYVVHVVEDGQIVTELIHKSCPRISLHPENTYDHEPLKGELDKIMGPFRRLVLSGQLGA